MLAKQTTVSTHYRLKTRLIRIFWTALIGAFALTMIVPFLWMISASLKRRWT